jgi:hypothetical protein
VRLTPGGWLLLDRLAVELESAAWLTRAGDMATFDGFDRSRRI